MFLVSSSENIPATTYDANLIEELQLNIEKLNASLLSFKGTQPMQPSEVNVS